MTSLKQQTLKSKAVGNGELEIQSKQLVSFVARLIFTMLAWQSIPNHLT
jgi:hypothetical protein